MFAQQQLPETRPITRYEHVKAIRMTEESQETATQFRIEGLRLHVFSHEDLSALAVCECTVPSIKGRGSPNDLRLGTLEDGQLCDTCHQTNIDCPGHLGIINLNRWYLHPKFVDQALAVLICVCNSCGEALITEKVVQRQGLHELGPLTRLKKMAEICVRQRCTNHPIDPLGKKRLCLPNPTYYPERMKDAYVVMAEYPNPMDKDRPIVLERTIEEIEAIFSRISPTSLRVLGFEGRTHPRNFVIRSIPVIPPCARPYVIRDGETSQDYLTTSYVDIIRYNNLVKHWEGETGDKVELERKKAIRNLYFFISHMIDNSDGRYTRSRDEPIQSIAERISDKTGYIRGAAMGKRVDQSGRSVLGPFNRLRFGEVAYPGRMQHVHTTPVKVIPANLDIIREMYRADAISHITVGSGNLKGRRFKIMPQTKDQHLPQIGDTVDRWAQDGDETLFNRQPTLHKQSLMGYRARYVPGYECIGLHSSYTSPHNADFDGDEGNKHKIQTLGARAETRYIADVGSCIMSAQSNRPIMGLMYNAMTSAYLLSQDETMVTEGEWKEAVECLEAGIPAAFEARLGEAGISKLSGRAVFSLLLPADFHYTSGKVRIRKGILLAGPLTGKQLGPTAGSIVHHLWKTYGKVRTAQYFTEGQWLLDWYLEKRGFGIGLRSVIARDPERVREIIAVEATAAQMKIEALGPVSPSASPLELEIREKEIQGFLNNITSIGKRIGLEALETNNPLNVMANSGAKGKDVNTAQIVGCLGQQYIKGERAALMMTNRTRALPYYEPGTNDIEARGFVPESFFEGVRPGGFIFHMMASRIGLTDTALKTADTGHMHHRINKALEDFYVRYDGSVRNALGVIFEYSYSDGFNAGELIPTESEALGKTISFIDLPSLAGRLNAAD